VTTLTSLARAAATTAGRAQPLALVRHVHISDRPMVFVPLTLAGEANAPLAAMVGTDPESPQLLVVPQPRNRDQRFLFAARLADIVVAYAESFSDAMESVTARGAEPRTRSTDAPQMVVPNPGGIDFVRLFGRSTRYRSTDGPYPVGERVPLLGRWLTFLAERAEHPGSCLLVAATEALTLHWATGQSPTEDLNLATVLAWIDPPTTTRGDQAAERAEDPLVCPPAGPATDPTFDNEVLAPLVRSYDEAPDGILRQRALARLEAVLRTQLEPTWRLVWRAIELLRAVPAGGRVAARWTGDRDAYTAQVRHLAEGGPPQPRWDSAVAAARRLNRLELAKASYDAQRALDDPLVLAESRMTGEAFAGTVIHADPTHTIGTGRSRALRPRIFVTTTDPIRLTLGSKVADGRRPTQTAVIKNVLPGPGGMHSTDAEAPSVDPKEPAEPIRTTTVELELTGGMGRGLTAPPGTMPSIGDRVAYTSILDSYRPIAGFPSRDDTPWTHGGPPGDYQPTDEDANEEWS
jgi:hypothetical protein